MQITVMMALAIACFYGILKLCIGHTFSGFVWYSPLVSALVVGIICGNVATAMTIGAALQLIYLGVIAPGGQLPADQFVATCVTIPIALASGMQPAVAVTLAVPIGFLGVQLTNFYFVIAGFFARKADTMAEKGDFKGVERWAIWYCSVVKFMIYAIPCFVAIYFGNSAIQKVVALLPERVTTALSVTGSILPALGFAIIANFIGKRKYFPFFFASYMLAAYSGVGIMGTLFAGLFIVFLYMTLSQNKDDETNVLKQEEMSDTVSFSGALKKKDVTRVFWRFWLEGELCHSYERMMGTNSGTLMIPALKKMYPNSEDKPKLIEAVKRNMVFFNTQTSWGGMLHGILLAMEEKKAAGADIPGEMIVNVRTALMGPFAGIGDTLDWTILFTLLCTIAIPAAQNGSWIAGVWPLALFTTITCIEGVFLTHLGYKVGLAAADRILQSGAMRKVIEAGSILGLFMMGGLAAKYIHVMTPLTITTTTSSISIQTMIDSIAPSLLPLVTVTGVWAFLAKHKKSMLAAALGLMLISFGLGLLGILG